MSVEITQHKNLIYTKAWPVMYKAIVELMDAGLINQTFDNVHHSYHGIVAWNGEDVVGFICYEFLESSNVYHINLAYVVPSHRREGIHTKMFERLVTEMKTNGVRKINSGTMIDNIAAQKAFEAQGRVATSINYTYLNPEFKP